MFIPILLCVPFVGAGLFFLWLGEGSALPAYDLTRSGFRPGGPSEDGRPMRSGPAPRPRSVR